MLRILIGILIGIALTITCLYYQWGLVVALEEDMVNCVEILDNWKPNDISQ